MTMFLAKVLISAVVIAAVSELAKRYNAAAAILAALPLTSILAMLWLYHDTRDPQKIAALSLGVFWAVLPSLGFFLALPWLLKRGFSFGMAMTLGCVGMVGAYLGYAWILRRFHIQF